jgi:hypothetical protein
MQEVQTTTLRCRVSQSENEAVRHQVSQSGLSLNEFLRRKILEPERLMVSYRILSKINKLFKAGKNDEGYEFIASVVTDLLATQSKK